MNKFIKSAAAAVATLAVAVSSVIAPLTASAWSDNITGGRPELKLVCTGTNLDNCTFTNANGTARSFIGDYTPVFNSISNNPNYGDERNFVSALASDQDIHANIWEPNTITVEDGKEYIIRMYIHNDNPNATQATAHNVKVAFSIPSTTDNSITVGGYVNSSNANATQIYDDIVFTSGSNRAFHLEYQYGSAMLYNNGFATANGTSFADDSIVTKASQGGALIGYNGFDGNIPGCFEYTQLVTIRVKAVYDDFTIDKKVRKAGTDDPFTESIDVAVGDLVEYRIEYHNILEKTGNATQDATKVQSNVMIKDVLPENMVYVENSTYLYNSNHPNGDILTPDGDLFTHGVNIGSYGPNARGYVIFTARVVDNSLACGSNILVNWAQGAVDGVVRQDHTTANLTKVCVNELPSTGPVAVIGSAVAAGTVVTAAGYFLMNRRANR